MFLFFSIRIKKIIFLKNFNITDEISISIVNIFTNQKNNYKILNLYQINL